MIKPDEISVHLKAEFTQASILSLKWLTALLMNWVANCSHYEAVIQFNLLLTTLIQYQVGT